MLPSALAIDNGILRVVRRHVFAQHGNQYNHAQGYRTNAYRTVPRIKRLASVHVRDKVDTIWHSRYITMPILQRRIWYRQL